MRAEASEQATVLERRHRVREAYALLSELQERQRRAEYEYGQAVKASNVRLPKVLAQAVVRKG